MKNILNIGPTRIQKINSPPIKRQISLRRLSPFLWFSIFLFFFFIYKVTINTGTQTQLILLPFLIANMAYADFALWNYFEGKKKATIWIVESLISAGIIYWAI